MSGNAANDVPTAERRLTSLPLVLSGLFLIFSLAWVGLSDRWLILASLEGPIRNALMVAKGFAFVGASALFVYVVTRHLVRRAMAAEARQREHESARATLFDDHPIPAWVMDADTHRPLAVNIAALKQYGMDRDAFMQGDPADLQAESDDVPLHDPPASGTTLHRRRDGSTFYAASTSAPTTFHGQKAVLVLARDVTYEHQLEAARNEAFEQAQSTLSIVNAVMEITRDAFWSWEFGSEDIWWSDSYTVSYGSPTGRMPVTEWLEHVHPDDRSHLAEQLRALSLGHIETLEMEHRYQRADRSWAEVRATAVAIRDAQGKVLRLIGAMQDVSEQRAQQRELRLQAAALSASREGICIVDALAEAQPLVYVNRAFEKLTGYTQEEVLGRNCRLLQGRDRDQPERELMRNAIAQGREMTVRLRNYRKDGSRFWNELSIAPVRQNGQITHYVGLQKDVTRRHLQEEQGAYQSRVDSLTGLATHIAFSERLEQSLRMHPDDAFALMHIDLDRMAAINEALGHAGGDELLAAMGQRLDRFVEAGEIAARIGGDKFVVVLHIRTDGDDPLVRARLLLEKLSEPQVIGGRSYSVTASIGVSYYPGHGRDIAHLMTRSEIAMQRAKWAGRNNIQVSEHGDGGSKSNTLHLLERLRIAIAQDALEVHFQPQIALPDGAITGFEGLLRWHDEELGQVPPSLFIPVAEDNGLVDAISHITLQAAARQVAEWSRDFGFRGTVGFNVSPLQSRRSGLDKAIAEALATYRVPPGQLEMELTESTAMGGSHGLLELMRRIVDLGVPIAIDDFGTGYSNFAYLRRFPVHRVKIDRSFIRDIAHDREDRMVVRAIIKVAQGLGLDNISEGVENEDQALVLSKEGCNAFQGFLYSPGVNAQSATDMLRRGDRFHMPSRETPHTAKSTPPQAAVTSPPQ